MPTYRGQIGSSLGPVQNCHNCNPGSGPGYYAAECGSLGIMIYLSSVDGCDNSGQGIVLGSPYNNLSIGDVIFYRPVGCNTSSDIYCAEIQSIVSDNTMGYIEKAIVDVSGSNVYNSCGTCQSNIPSGPGPGPGTTYMDIDADTFNTYASAFLACDDPSKLGSIWIDCADQPLNPCQSGQINLPEPGDKIYSSNTGGAWLGGAGFVACDEPGTGDAAWIEVQNDGTVISSSVCLNQNQMQ